MFRYFERIVIASLLGGMTILTFANVVARYVFKSNILWALELTVFIFAWLVLLGAAHAIAIRAHLGIDILLNALSPKRRRIIGLVSGLICVAYSVLILKGSWDYWSNYANLPATTGRWFPIGFDYDFRPQGWYEVYSIPIPESLRFLEAIFNEGDAYEKLPRFIPYFVLPLAAFLMLLRFITALINIYRGNQLVLIASHEVAEKQDNLLPESTTP